MRTLFHLITGLLGAIYMLNPTAGFLELIPDNAPIIGNLDEFAASALVIAALSFFGKKIFGEKEESKDTTKEFEG